MAFGIKGKIIFGTIALVAILVISGAFLTVNGISLPGKEEQIAQEEPEMTDLVGSLDTISGSTEEGDTTATNLDFGDLMIKEVRVRMTWNDDMPSSQPDEFELVLNSPEGDSESIRGEEGELEVVLIMPEAPCCAGHGAGDEQEQQHESDMIMCGNPTTEGWYVEVRSIEAGDDPLGPLGLLKVPDNGNGWNIDVEFIYCSACGGEIGHGTGGGGCH